MSRSTHPPTSLGRVALRRVARPVPAGNDEPVIGRATPWSRGLWGVFLPDRRGDAAPRPPGGHERRTA